MEHKILFRGKRVDNGEWIYGYFCECPCDDGTDIMSIMRIERKGNHKTLMQYPVISETVGRFTGLTDKNGTKIFEGDIIEYNEIGVYTYHVVVWNKYTWNLSDFYAAHFDYPSEAFSEGIEYMTIIGNIYDNPELIKLKGSHILSHKIKQEI